ncbi:copper-containing nitrite reductase [Pasteurellaceae bacterium LIM206]|nr:copper-containing nitrite reductase [Pasteurellaceae bacterium LIM206]
MQNKDEQLDFSRRDLLKATSLGLAATTLTFGAGLSLVSPGITAAETGSTGDLPVIEAELTFAPNVPKPTGRSTPARVVVKLTALEKVKEIANGVTFKYWTFNNSVPAPFIRVREGDQVEVHLSNSANARMAHALDFHASSAPEGTAKDSLTNPGQTTVLAFKATTPGLYLYHCGAEPVAVHIGKGMYGLMLVEPKEGLPPVDKEFYIMQSELYVRQGAKDGMLVFDMNKADYELPDYVMFNGNAFALTGDNALKVKTGDRVRLYFGNAGPNKHSSLHVVGNIFETVYVEGGSLQNHNVQTTLVPAGSALMTELKFDVPGQYTIMDHAIFRTMKGAKGTIIVEGESNPNIYQGKIRQEKYDQKNPDADVDSGYSH